MYYSYEANFSSFHPLMAYAGSNDAKINFVRGAVFAKFGLFFPENCNFALDIKGIAALRIILVPISQNSLNLFQWRKNEILGRVIFVKFVLFSKKIAFLLLFSKALQIEGYFWLLSPHNGLCRFQWCQNEIWQGYRFVNLGFFAPKIAFLLLISKVL